MKEDHRGRGNSREGSSPGVSEEALASIGMPERLESPFGAMEFFDGLPLPDTVQRSYDALDLMRGVEVFLNCMPGASMVAMRNGFRSIGQTASNVLGYTDPLATSANVVLTANTETTYGTNYLDLKTDGPTVIEAPAERAGLRRRHLAALRRPTSASPARTRVRAAST